MDKSTRQVGDWTQELFRLGLEQPGLPIWITAAQPSLMEQSIYFDNGRKASHTAVSRHRKTRFFRLRYINTRYICTYSVYICVKRDLRVS